MTAELKKWRRIFYSLSLNLNIFTNSHEKKTCLLLCLLCIFKFQTLTCQNFWIFYFTSRLTLYECVINVYIQRYFLIRNSRPGIVSTVSTVPFTEKRPRKPETVIKDGFAEEMEHGLFGAFRPEKQDYLFRFSVAPHNFPLERPKKSCSVYYPTRFSGNFF